MGVSYDLLNDKNLRLDTDKINYKLGLQWDITSALRLRAAAFETMKRLLIVDQTIEPTQVAGFGQFFDDFNATETQRYGIGIDARLTKKTYGGLEVSKRNLAKPIIRSTGTTVDNQEEDLYRAYVYTMLSGDWTLSFEPQYERFASETNSTKLVKTLNIPITAQYFSESGFLANLRTSYVHQEVGVRPANPFNETVENFTVIDAGFGYRLPKRRGILSFEVRNLLDGKFLFQDLGFRVSDPTSINPEFVPDRTILVRVTLDF